MTSVPTLTPESRLTILTLRVQDAICQSLAPLEITAWRTAEPVAFTKREKGERQDLSVGDIWGKRLFDCAWFRFRAAIPAGAGSNLALRIDINGELCLVGDEGMPLRGLTCVESTFDRSLGTPAKTIFRLSDAWKQRGEIEIWGDAGFNDLFGSLPGEGRIRIAELCSYRDDLRALYYDLEVLSEVLVTSTEETYLEEIRGALDEAERLLVSLDVEKVAAARSALAPLFCAPSSAPSFSVSAIGHAHLDLAWLWPIRETIRKGARTFANALYNIERYPEYIFGASQPQLYQWMREHYPALYTKIKDAVKAGKIEPQGVFWVEPDCNLVSGESLVRQVLVGRRFFLEEFGVLPTYCWQPDVFGYNGQLPQILKKSGVDYFMTTKISWNVVNRFPYHSFIWEGIDGSRIQVHMPPEGTYNSPAAPRSLAKILKNYAEQAVSKHALLPFGIGDGGGGPDAEHLERLRREAHLTGLPPVACRSTADFFALWSQDAERLPVHQGELYLERHQGTFTTQALTKRLNRRCEIGLRELEFAASLALVRGLAPYPEKELQEMWEEVLLYQFHDILPGSSIKRVFDEANVRQQALLDRMQQLTASIYAALAAETAGTGRHVAFNSLPWPRREWQRIEEGWVSLEIPACGSAVLVPPVETEHAIEARPDRLENERLRLRFSEDGTIASLWSNDLQRELMPPSSAANEFVIYEDRGDAWDFEIDYEKKDMELYLRQAPRRPLLVDTRAWVDGPRGVVEHRFEIGTSTIWQRIVLDAGSDLLQFETEVDWNEPCAMLRTRFPLAIETPEVRCEIPFGFIKRSTGNTTSVERAQVEVPALQWIDFSEASHGATLITDCKYGYRLKGHVADLCVLRSVPFPRLALINKDDKSAAASESFTDLGAHAFRYALLPHGPFSAAQTTQTARQFNTPPPVVSRSRSSDDGSGGSFLEVSHPAIDLAALKRSEDKRGLIVRLCNTSEGSVQSTLRVPSARSAAETNLVEMNEKPLALTSEAEWALSFGPFEVKTIRLQY